MNVKIDYAIVGGGVAGTYCAWRLKQAYPDKKIVLYEYSNRIGGRLLTTRLDLLDVNAELGGMRYLPNEHKIFASLVQKLGLRSHPFPMGGQDDPSGQKNYAYFRGRHLKIGDLNSPDKVPYNISWAERNKSPDGLQAQVMETLVPNWKELNFDDWFCVEVFGRWLWEYGFWNLLYRVLTPEAFTFMRYGSGYDTNVSNGNAVTLLPTGGDYSSTNQYVTLVDGMEAVPKALAQQFEKQYEGDLQRNHRLVLIRRREDKHYALRFFRTKTLNGKTADAKPAEVVDVVAQHVILAMPRAALEAVEWECWKEDPFLHEHLGSVLMQSALKILLAYPYAWWKSLGLVAGRSITDLPLRQTFYFSATDELDPDTISKKPALLMASYSDIETVPFWKGLELEPDNLFAGPSEHRATVLMVQEAHRQVLAMHNQRELPLPYAAAYQDWSEKPFGAAWHSWKAGFKYNEIMPKMRHPVADENVYICGEAYSADQGWAEGALETAELLLTKDLDLAPHDITRSWKPDLMKRMRY